MKDHFLKYAHWIAGLLIVAGVAFFVFAKTDNPEPIVDPLFQPEKEKLESILSKIKVFGFAGEPQNREDSLAVALDLYGQANYEEAQTSLEGYLAAYPDDLTARFYQGMSHLYLKEPE
jgi:hypothetical protein